MRSIFDLGKIKHINVAIVAESEIHFFSGTSEASEHIRNVFWKYDFGGWGPDTEFVPGAAISAKIDWYIGIWGGNKGGACRSDVFVAFIFADFDIKIWIKSASIGNLLKWVIKITLIGDAESFFEGLIKFRAIDEGGSGFPFRNKSKNEFTLIGISRDIIS